MIQALTCHMPVLQVHNIDSVLHPTHSSVPALPCWHSQCSSSSLCINNTEQLYNLHHSTHHMHMPHGLPINTRNSSRDEIANVNFLYDEIVHAQENTRDSCINSATNRFLQCRFTKFSEITQCNGHYAVQGHLRSPILVPIESSYTTSY